ncbi:hypothetical protein AB0J83_11170 [Actinoplanes sp. NPDC049596]|uniref:hypothetical protein n=1 Tax=unclassified Actinoplanes TaxID=2626549 RepID=UPI0034224507
MVGLLNRVVAAIALLATSVAPAVREARDPAFTAHPKPVVGLPGEAIHVEFTYNEPPIVNTEAADSPATITSCEFKLDKDEKTTRCTYVAEDDTWTMVMPRPLKPGRHDVHWTVYYKINNDSIGTPDEGDFTFDSVEPLFRTTVKAPSPHPGQLVDVRFTSETDGVTITGCLVRDIKCGEDDGGWFARVPAPETTSAVPWSVGYTGGPGTEDTAPGRVEIKVEPWPAPEFQVGIAGSAEVGPGTPVSVKFESLTTGVDVKTCFVTYRGKRIDCGETDLATVTIPGDAETGPVEMPWELAFESSRLGEKDDVRTGSVKITVVVEEPRFSVAVQPEKARPGDIVTLTFTSLVPGVRVVDCVAFFPHAIGDTCRRSPQPRVVRTRIPGDLPPGVTLLRWGVESRDAAGRRGADDDVIPYLVLPPRPGTTPTTKNPTRPTTATTSSPGNDNGNGSGTSNSTGTGNGSGTGNGNGSGSGSGNGPGGGNGSDIGGGTDTGQVTSVAGPAPEFVAETRPETAPPGAPVTVVVSPLDPDVRILGCAVVFTGGGDRACRASGDRWSARTTVPAGASAGETLPLDWRVSFVAAAGTRADARGTTDYPVRGSAPVTPVFEVVADPAAAAIGKRVTVSHNSEATGVAITGCQVGFAGKSLTDCQRSPGGWTAQVEVPPAMPAGPNPLHWTIAYARSGGPGGTAQGLSSFRVLPPDPDDDHWWENPWGLLGRIALGGVLLVGLLAFRVAGKPILARFRPRPAAAGAGDRSAADEPAGDETPSVVPVGGPEDMSVQVDQPDALPARDIRLETRRPRLAPHVPEELT